eukprot:SAG11_NODE_11820_length_736_cov_1.852433_2_plen_76_part_00
MLSKPGDWIAVVTQLRLNQCRETNSENLGGEFGSLWQMASGAGEVVDWTRHPRYLFKEPTKVETICRILNIAQAS